MEGEGNTVTMREVTRERDSPVEQSDTKEETGGEKSSQGGQVSIGRSPGKREQKRSKGVVLLRGGKRRGKGKKL